MEGRDGLDETTSWVIQACVEPRAVVLPRAPGDNYHHVAVEGELDVCGSPRLQTAVFSVLEDGFSQGDVLVIHLEPGSFSQEGNEAFHSRGVGYADGSCLNVLIRALKKAQKAGGDIQLVVAHPTLERILAITKLDTLFVIHPAWAWND